MQDLVITFHSAHEAIECEDRINIQSLPARIIPIPACIKAGCGLGMLCQKHDSVWWKHWLEEENLPYETIWQGNLRG